MDKKIILLFGIFGVLLAVGMINTYATFSGTHTIYKNKTTPEDFCIKCHPDRVSSVSESVHANAGCICHGYSPNLTELYNINLAHNLTKNIYCTNCHSDYNITTGNITIHYDGGDISGINQSAHYIIESTANKTPIYQRAGQFFNNS